MTRTLNTVATDLERVAGDQAEGRYTRLAKALRTGDRSALVGADIPVAYAPDRLLPDVPPKTGIALRVLEIIRDVLVFVPVGFTWWKVSDALEAYSRYRGTDGFLLAWQRGFGFRPHSTEHVITPLGTTAFDIALLVGVLIALTLIGQGCREIVEYQVDRTRRRLNGLLAEAAVLVAKEPVPESAAASPRDLARIGAEITAATGELQQALRKAGADIVSAVNTNPGSELHTMFTAWTAAADRLGELGASLKGSKETLDELSGLQAALAQSITDFRAEAKGFLTELRRERKVAVDQAHAQQQVADGVGRSIDLLGSSLRALNDKAEMFHEIVNRIQFVVNRMEDDGFAPAYPISGNSEPPAAG